MARRKLSGVTPGSRPRRSSAPSRAATAYHISVLPTSVGAFVRARVFVVGMDLHRELVLGEDEFDEQRDAGLAAKPAAGPFRGQSGPCFAQRAPGEFAAGEAALFARSARLRRSGRCRLADRRAEPGCARPRCAARRPALDARGELDAFTWRLRRRRRSARGAAGLPRCAPWTWRRRSAGSRARRRRPR